MKDLIVHYLEVYGYITLYFIYFIELLGVPLPGETIMVYVGYLSWVGSMSWILSVLAVTAGAISGVSSSYLIGLKIGSPLVHKYGRYIGLGPERFAKAEQCIALYGKKILIVAYFIPGLRHLSGYISGVLEIPFHIFAVNAYSGALLYAVAFISLGNRLGPEWQKALKAFQGHFLAFSVVLVVLICVYFFWKYKRTVM